MCLVGIALGYIFSLHPESFDFPICSGIEHFGDGEARFARRSSSPELVEPPAHVRVSQGLVSRDLVWHAAHVGVSLNVILPAQGEHARPRLTYAAGQHSQIAQRHD